MGSDVSHDEFSQLPPAELEIGEQKKNPGIRNIEPEQGVEVDPTLLKPETLQALITEFVLREGTDYGSQEATLDRKINDVKRQLERKELEIVFDLTTETCSIVPKKRSR
jgi:uncharacterized protein YheU (UPF0270 family)